MADSSSDRQKRPFSVIPQSLRDAAAQQRLQRRSSSFGDECGEAVLHDGAVSCGSSAGVSAGRSNAAYDEGQGFFAEPASLDRYGIPENASLEERLALVQRMMEREAAAYAKVRQPRQKSPLHGVLQDFIDGLFEGCSDECVKRLDVVVAADSADLPPDLMEIIELLPPGTYTRQRLCGQLNSAIGAHAWGHTYGMVR